MSIRLAFMSFALLLAFSMGCATGRHSVDPVVTVTKFHEKAKVATGQMPKDVTNMVASLDGVAITEMGMKDFKEIDSAFGDGSLLDYDIIGSRTQYKCALVLVLYQLTAKEPGGRTFDSEAVRLVRQQGEWKYVPFDVPYGAFEGDQQSAFRLLYEWSHKAWSDYYTAKGIIP